MQMYALLDKKMGVYGSVMSDHNDNSIVRSLSDFLGSDNSSVQSRHPEDFDLYHLGEYDVASGQVESTGPRFVLNLSSVKAVS